jgi:hypothetical protein
MTATTIPATIQIRRRHLLGLILAVAALMAALTWATVTIVDDDSTPDRVVRPAAPAAAAAVANPVAVEDRPSTVADAYHGVGVRYCLEDGLRPATVADVYHGIGIAVCV